MRYRAEWVYVADSYQEYTDTEGCSNTLTAQCKEGLGCGTTQNISMYIADKNSVSVIIVGRSSLVSQIVWDENGSPCLCFVYHMEHTN